jgi:virulence-associated protein VapD
MRYYDLMMMLIQYVLQDSYNNLYRKIEAFVDVHDRFQHYVHVLHVKDVYVEHVVVNEIEILDEVVREIVGETWVEVVLDEVRMISIDDDDDDDKNDL